MEISKETIRQAIIKNRGGLITASGEEIKTIWDALSAETQKEYLDTIEQKTEDRTQKTGE